MRKSGQGPYLGRIYARSLFDLAEQEQILDRVEQDLLLAQTLLDQEPLFRRFIESPYFVPTAKQALLKKVFQDRVQDLTLRFWYVVIQHERALYFSDMLKQFHAMLRARDKRREVRVTVPVSLDTQTRTRLVRNLTDAMKSEVDLEVTVDPSLLGGAVIRYDDRLVDNSVRGRLRRMVHDIMQRKGMV